MTKREQEERAAFQSYTKDALIDLVMTLKGKLREAKNANDTKAALTFEDGVARGKQIARAKDD